MAAGERTSPYIPAPGELIRELLREPRLAPLGPGTPNQAAHPLLANATLAGLFAATRIHDKDMAKCCLAGLWLYHDFLDESHKICQDIETPTGSYWHALMHRREPDYGNSKYWFNRVGMHPVFAELHLAAQELAVQAGDEGRFLGSQAQWDPFAFVDLCEKAAGDRADLDDLCRRIQLREWELLFDHCYRRAIGG
jgi:hypothetical protein